MAATRKSSSWPRIVARLSVHPSASYLRALRRRTSSPSGCFDTSHRETADSDRDCRSPKAASVLNKSTSGAQKLVQDPKAAYDKAPAFFQRTRGFDESRIIENRIAQLLQAS